MRRAARATPDGRRPSAHAPAAWPVVLAGGMVVGAATLAAVLVGGPPARQAVAGVAVAALSAVGCAVPLWRARRELRHLQRREQAATKFATAIADAAAETALESAVQVLLPDACVVALHRGGRRADLHGLGRVVVDDAIATGLPAEVPDGTTGRETARLLALPLVLGGRGRGAVLLRVDRASQDDVADVQRLLARLAPALVPPAASGNGSSDASAPVVAAPSSQDAGRAPEPAPPPPPPAVDGGAGDAGDSRLHELVARAAHDLRTPLNTLTGMVDTLVRHGDQLSPSQREQFHAAMQRSTRRIAGWITAMLDAAVDERARPAHIESCRLQPLLEEAVMVSHAATAGLEVYVAPTDLSVVADPGGVVRVVGNLLANAGHHAQGGNTVEVEARPCGDQVEVCVRDHGDGFEQGTSSAGRAPAGGGGHHAGLGLGLASVRSQVASWGGELELDETPGGGATVCFTLPRAMAEDRGRGGRDDTRWTIAGSESHIRGAQRAARPPSTGAGRGDGPWRRRG